MFAKYFDDLVVYKKSFELQQRVFLLSREFPREERYSLTDQFRRCSRSVSANIAEAWGRRRYQAAFVHKLSEVEGEACECICWIDTCEACGYLPSTEAENLRNQYREVIRMLASMIHRAEDWCRI